MCIFQTMNEWGFLKTKTVSLSHRSRSHRSSRRRHSRSRSRRRHSRSRSYSREYRRSRSHSPMSNRRRHVGNRVRTSCISLSLTHTRTQITVILRFLISHTPSSFYITQQRRYLERQHFSWDGWHFCFLVVLTKV